MPDTWTDFCARVAEIDALNAASGVLGWDQQVTLPRGGHAHRGAHLAALAGVIHERLVHPALGELVEALERDADPQKRRAALVMRRRRDPAVRTPAALVREMAAAQADGFPAWMAARDARDFDVFAPALRRLVALTKARIGHLGPAAHPYDHLLEEHDPGVRTAELVPLFDRLGAALAPFVAAVADRPQPPPLGVEVPSPALFRVSHRILDAMGFRADDGRLDASEHPFSMGIGVHDVRLTLHPDPHDLLGTLGGTIHEGGHGLYEQGLPEELAGTGLCAAAGMGLHESQSRFWENTIGRSAAFSQWLSVVLAAEAGRIVDPATLFRAANRVERSLIRVKADEVTYNLHILVRTRLEIALFAGDLSVDDLPAAWDEAYAALLGVRPAHATEGVLQDIHWSGAAFGYFPSYTLGNLYAAGMGAALVAERPGVWDEVARGELGPILAWLRPRVHARGCTADAPEIVRDAVGERDLVEDLLAHLRARQEAVAAG
jgi:carboxypeptidase Taq